MNLKCITFDLTVINKNDLTDDELVRELTNALYAYIDVEEVEFVNIEDRE